jgi:hypothetical protein
MTDFSEELVTDLLDLIRQIEYEAALDELENDHTSTPD